MSEWNQCWYCGAYGKKVNRRIRRSRTAMALLNGLTVDHVVPKSAGGDRCVTACARCNYEKADLSLTDYRECLAGPEYRFFGEVQGWLPW